MILPNSETILFQIQEVSASARSIERCMTDIVGNMTIKQNVGLRKVAAFSDAIDECTDMNDMVHLATVAKYCDNHCIYEELYYLPIQ